ncbi:hypothetical protein WR25_24485 [Diploscapter pachys]|uniref:Galectin n=1 Tax=Diploscapter pachys TaxID=2018661 RepID=A0A2A2KMZ0_9BILA|nr:hypothetical protein WR25_24485 [Diploscapter pachys]
MPIGSGAGIHFGNEFFNPPVPVEIPVQNFNNGGRLRLVVKPTHGDRFQVNLKTPDDIILHFSARFDEQAIVRNSTQNGSWQNEERFGDFPFRRDHVYTIEFLSNNGVIAILINGQPYADFLERLPGHNIHLIEISGDVHVHSAHVTH